LKYSLKLICALIALLLTVGKSLSQDADKYRDSLLLEIKYAEQKDKVDLSMTFIKEFYKEIPDKIIVVVDEALEQASASKLDSIDQGSHLTYWMDIKEKKLHVIIHLNICK